MHTAAWVVPGSRICNERFMPASCESRHVSAYVPNAITCPSSVDVIGRGEKMLFPQQMIEDTQSANIVMAPGSVDADKR